MNINQKVRTYLQIIRHIHKTRTHTTQSTYTKSLCSRRIHIFSFSLVKHTYFESNWRFYASSCTFLFLRSTISVFLGSFFTWKMPCEVYWDVCVCVLVSVTITSRNYCQRYIFHRNTTLRFLLKCAKPKMKIDRRFFTVKVRKIVVRNSSMSARPAKNWFCVIFSSKSDEVWNLRHNLIKWRWFVSGEGGGMKCTLSSLGFTISNFE